MLELIPVCGDRVTIRINWAASEPSDRAHSNEQPVDADCAKLEELARRVAWCEEEIWESPCSEPAAGSDLGRRVDQLEASLGEAIEGTLEERVAAIVERLIEEDQEEPEAAAEKVPPEPTKPSPQPEAAHKAPDETKESARGTGRIYPTPHAGVYNAGSIGRRSTGKAFFKSVMGGDDQVVDAHCKSTTFDPNWRHERLRIHDAGDGHVGLYCPKSDRWVATTPEGEAKTFQAGETYLKSWEWERFLVTAPRALCSVCNKMYAMTKSGMIWTHKLADGSKCTGSGKQSGGDKRPRGSNSSRNSAEPQKKAGRAA